MEDLLGPLYWLLLMMEHRRLQFQIQAGTNNRIMVKGTNHERFDVSNTNFTITAGSTDTIAQQHQHWLLQEQLKLQQTYLGLVQR
jgi:hypothetical protein